MNTGWLIHRDSTTAENRGLNRKYTAKTVKDLKQNVNYPWPSADKNICRIAENRGLNRISVTCKGSAVSHKHQYGDPVSLSV